jgi:hypothetical protein
MYWLHCALNINSYVTNTDVIKQSIDTILLIEYKQW